MYGIKIKMIQIKLTDPSIEDKDRKFSLIDDSELPDYRLILNVNGQTIKSEILHNATASDWLQFEIGIPFYLRNLDEVSIVNRQLLTSKILQKIESPTDMTTGELLEIRYARRWGI